MHWFVVHKQCSLHYFHIDVQVRSSTRNSYIVHQDANIKWLDLVNEFFDFVRVRHINNKRFNSDIWVLVEDRFSSGFQLALLDIGHNEVETHLSELSGIGVTNAICGPCNKDVTISIFLFEKSWIEILLISQMLGEEAPEFELFIKSVSHFPGD